MLALMRDFDQNHRHRQRMLLAAALIGLGLLFVTFLTAGGQAWAETTDGMAATPPAPSQSGLDKKDSQALAEASAYLSSLEDMQGDFLQVGPDGSVAEGKFYLRRPGRLRFEYEPPENLLVVADGTWVAVKDSSAPAQRYPIASTPLSLLLAENVNLSESARVLNVETQPGALLVTLADSTGEAPGQITLIFDQPRMQLRQWVVTDAQGLQTTVALRNVETGIRADNSLFVLRDNQRPQIGPR
ncbi:outer membrane lipoprotein carrier protein LolA [Parvibaculum sp.]|uniref:LolA family protein n=1 Tax=Parvibaculum sp. TaxID=2024848 RepID=UPI001B191D02|nr:outer membrane lipoprotein carrier protein LolA [Parvibaculum sp.]MBO6633103.1 outer membrane lipoprotein carrier protein LolA [Parvibaculum sp.]MBO6677417.1 outer membrane lipoprotein carrier protein LolA [Parvibaculum sp.]MBO6686165.1 outer membrane lipoprotein carrier protein LolA [Parvibaculum sp.]MBO6903923.1 outer membrane lipoprotein carrier protein LolA [Parvibaculum sp.]